MYDPRTCFDKDEIYLVQEELKLCEHHILLLLLYELVALCFPKLGQIMYILLPVV
jgi:hypothetical protein